MSNAIAAAPLAELKPSNRRVTGVGAATRKTDGAMKCKSLRIRIATPKKQPTRMSRPTRGSRVSPSKNRLQETRIRGRRRRALFWAAFLWVLYMALEPAVKFQFIVALDTGCVENAQDRASAANSKSAS